MQKKLIFFISSWERYYQEIKYLLNSINRKNYHIYIENIKNISGENISQINHIWEIKIKKEDILIGYGRGFWGGVFEHLPYLFPYNKIFVIEDGIRIDLNNLKVRLQTSAKIELIKRYLKFYGIFKFLKIVYKTLFIKKVHKLYNIKPFGLLEFSLLQEQKLPNILQKKQILILEQPFLLFLEAEKQKKFFYFLEEFCKKNSEYSIIFKLHPRTDKTFYTTKINAKNLIFKQEGNIIEYILESEYILGFFSTAMFSALLFDKKVITIDPIGIFKDIKKFEILAYNNTWYLQSPQKISTIPLRKDWKKSNKDELLFNFDAFKKEIE